MKKLFILFAFVLGSLPLFAQSWNSEEIQKVMKNYDTLVQKLSDEEREQLTENQEYVKDALTQIEKVQLYTVGGWADPSVVENIAEILQNIKDRYDNSLYSQEPFGAWLAVQIVKTKDMQIGFLGALFTLIGEQSKDHDTSFDLIMMAEKIRINYSSVLLMD